MKEVVVISGKGGTGKTSFMAYFALQTERAVFADCDVDAPNLHLLLKPSQTQAESFIGTKVAVMDQAKCTGCGKCIDACRFDALARLRNNGGGKVHVLEGKCEGCALCTHICPEKALKMEDRVTGDLFLSKTSVGMMVHALLKPGQENSGKLVARVKSKARSIAKLDGNELILVDGPPGIGCPVISALSGADLTVVVTEPTASGLSDLRRVLDLAKGFHIPSCVVVNKFDLNDEMTATIEREAAAAGAEVIGRVPYDEALASAIAKGSDDLATVRCPATEAMKDCHERMMARVRALETGDGGASQNQDSDHRTA